MLKFCSKFYQGKNHCFRHQVFYDQYPFEFNNIGILDGESRDYDVFVTKHNNFEDLDGVVQQLDHEAQGKSKSRFNPDIIFMNDVAFELVARDRPKVSNFLQEQCLSFASKSENHEIKIEFPKSLIIHLNESLEVSLRSSYPLGNHIKARRAGDETRRYFNHQALGF